MYCPNCGEQIDDKAVVCPKCGVPVKNTVAPYDSPSKVFAVLGFLFPIIGLILYLVGISERPLRAKSAGKGALIGFIVGIVFSIISYIIAIAAVGCAATYYSIMI